MPHKDPVSSFFVSREGPVPLQLVLEIEEAFFDEAKDVVPGRKQIAATPVPGLSWQKLPRTKTPKSTLVAGKETN